MPTDNAHWKYKNKQRGSRLIRVFKMSVKLCLTAPNAPVEYNIQDKKCLTSLLHGGR